MLIKTDAGGFNKYSRHPGRDNVILEFRKRSYQSANIQLKNKNSKMDYNKLIRDIIKATKEDPALCINDPDSGRLITTLKVEVKVSKTISENLNEEAINSTKLVLLRIND